MSELTPELLTARLEALSTVAIRSGAAAPAIARLLEAASVATLQAVALDLLYSAPVQDALVLVPVQEEVRALVANRPAAARPVLTRLLDAA